MIVFGINPVIEAVRTGRVVEVWIVDRPGARLAGVVEEVTRARVPVQSIPRADLDRMCAGRPHQGVAADLPSPRDYGIDDVIAASAGPPLILVLDGIEDPQNLGAIVRTADAAGVSGIVRQKRRSATLGGGVARASAGALAHARIASVVNIARAIEQLKAAGVWTVGLVAGGDRRYDQVDLTLPTALVVGAEGTGLRRLVRERCDWLVSIPMLGRVESLNVSVAAGVALFEAVRQRGGAAGTKMVGDHAAPLDAASVEGRGAESGRRQANARRGGRRQARRK